MSPVKVVRLHRTYQHGFQRRIAQQARLPDTVSPNPSNLQVVSDGRWSHCRLPINRSESHNLLESRLFRAG